MEHTGMVWKRKCGRQRTQGTDARRSSEQTAAGEVLERRTWKTGGKLTPQGGGWPKEHRVFAVSKEGSG